MSKKILIVEADSSLAGRMREALEAKGFSAEETSDGKGCLDLVRQQRPELVVLAVELPAGQNGYILCGKLKKDDELKSIPVVIVGSPDGFGQHKKLKTRADEYVAKPVDLDAFVNTIGGVIGFPESEMHTEVLEEGISLSDLVEEDSSRMTEELALEPAQDETTVAGDPDLDMLDAVFEEEPKTADEDEPLSALEPIAEAAPETSSEATQEISALEEIEAPSHSDETLLAIDSLGDGAEGATEMHITAHQPVEKPASKPPPMPRGGGADAGELRELRAKVAELEAAVTDAQHRASEAESKVHELENELTHKHVELESAKSGGKSDKDFFALREAANKKDKEILRLKAELNEKDQEIVELRDREMQLEQQVSESSGEMAKRDAQVKTLTARADQLAAERKKSDQQLLSAKEEARSASAKLITLQAELEQLQSQMSSSSSELESLRSRNEELEAENRKSQDEMAQIRAEIESLRGSNESLRIEAETTRGQLDQAQMDLDAAKNQLSAQANQHEEEAGGLRKRLSELEDSSSRHEERLTKLYARIKGSEKVREKTKKALAVALQLLDEHQEIDLDEDESAAA